MGRNRLYNLARDVTSCPNREKESDMLSINEVIYRGSGLQLSNPSPGSWGGCHRETKLCRACKLPV
jgi:hypothetical protein